MLVQVTDLLEERPDLTLGHMGNEVVADLIQAGTGAEVEESEVRVFVYLCVCVSVFVSVSLCVCSCVVV